VTLNGEALGAVAEARFATTLATPRGPVATVEHLLAALRIAGVDDVAIEIEGGEAPALDGSAAGWVLPTVEVAGERAAWHLDRPILVRDGEAWVRAEPADVARVCVDVEFPGLGRQVFAADEGAWATEVAPARTFGFLRDEAGLRAAGLIAGVSLENAVVFDDEGRALRALRFPEEPARHKALDLIGDLFLLGGPLRASVTAVRAGHRLHHRLVEAIRAQA
jgi:UDP-3-O-[3-hydroxymyristoyl] N-acetylglucosamine deacetylase